MRLPARSTSPSSAYAETSVAKGRKCSFALAGTRARATE
jgi:hypothetical protein